MENLLCQDIFSSNYYAITFPGDTLLGTRCMAVGEQALEVHAELGSGV